MDLTTFPRRRYTQGATPIEFLPRLSEALGGPDIYIKRDDMLGLAAGGNKTRKLEFLMADAIRQGVDTVLTCGAIQSNHCRLTLGAAVKEGLKCQLILEECVPGTYDENAAGNNYLFKLLGAEKLHLRKAGIDANAELALLAAKLEEEGRHPYPIPVGGSNPIGALGYVACMQEILQQSFEMGVHFDRIFCPIGSAGTYAGLLCGIVGTNANIPLTAVSVSGMRAVQTRKTLALTDQLVPMLGMKTPVTEEDIDILDAYVGPGYSLPTKAMGEAVRLVARTESILLDPVYSGKTMSGLIDQIRRGVYKKGESVLFLHTGGSPALYVYMDATLSED